MQLQLKLLKQWQFKTALHIIVIQINVAHVFRLMNVPDGKWL